MCPDKFDEFLSDVHREERNRKMMEAEIEATLADDPDFDFSVVIEEKRAEAACWAARADVLEGLAGAERQLESDEPERNENGALDDYVLRERACNLGVEVEDKAVSAVCEDVKRTMLTWLGGLDTSPEAPAAETMDAKAQRYAREYAPVQVHRFEVA